MTTTQTTGTDATMYQPTNPASLVGHHVVFTDAVKAEVPAFRLLGPTILEVTEFYGVIGGEPQYGLALTSDRSQAFEAFLSEVRLVGATGAEIRSLMGLVSVVD